MNCKTCNGATSGFKCEGCGTETADHTATCTCGPEHVHPKCVACNEAETKCSCAAPAAAE